LDAIEEGEINFFGEEGVTRCDLVQFPGSQCQRYGSVLHSILLGEAFVACSQEDAQAHVEQLKLVRSCSLLFAHLFLDRPFMQATAAKLASFVKEIADIEDQRTKLRASLYSRFGDSIGLDDADG
jgi:hypothetical protein